MREFFKWFKCIAPVVVTLAIFLFLFYSVQWAQMWRILVMASMGPFLAAVLAALVASTLIGTLRLRMIMDLLGRRVPFREVFLIKMGSISLNLLPSGHMDLLSQAVYLNRNKGFSFVSGLQYIVLALFMNFIAMLLPVIWILLFCWPSGGFPEIERYRLAVVVCCAAAIVPVLIWGGIKVKMVKGMVLAGLGKIRSNWALETARLVELYSLMSGRKMAGLLACSMVFQYSQFLVFYLLSVSLGISMSWLHILLFLPLVTILSSAPVTEGGFGLREFLILYFYASYGGKELILALALLFSFAEYVVPAFFGMFFMNAYLKRFF